MIVSALFAAAALSSARQDGSGTTWDQVMAARLQVAASGRYLPTLQLMEKYLGDNKTSLPPERHDQLVQLIGYQYSFMGDVHKAGDMVDQSLHLEAVRPPETSPFGDAKAEDALKAIVREARNRQIVILNESHHVPQGRWFAARVAVALRNLGFEYFAAETFSAPGALGAAWKKGYPSRSLGYYTCEPTYAELVRQVMRVGYKPVAYEADVFRNRVRGPDSAKTREIQQADNLVAQIFAQNPRARVLIFCGYSHATEDWTENEQGEEEGWMAARLKKLTGIDPLTIDQAWARSMSNPQFSMPEYQFADSKRWLTTHKVFRKADGGYTTFGEVKDKVDMQVFSPKETLLFGRPKWLESNGARKPWRVPASLVPGSGRVLLQAYVATEPTDAVPVDQVLLEAGANPLPLMLPRGSFRLALQDSTGGHTTLRTIRIP